MATFTALNGGETRTPKFLQEAPTSKSSAPHEVSSISINSSEQKEKDHHPVKPEPQVALEHAPLPHHSAVYADNEFARKRRRSDSPDPRSAFPRGASDCFILDSVRPSSRKSRNSPLRAGGQSGDHGEAWYEKHHHEEDRNRYDHRDSSVVDDHGADSSSLQGKTGSVETQQYSPISPDGDEPTFYGGSFPPDIRADGTLSQSEQKRRKRNFSNRTKTGCVTCRKRKKKCDEGKPVCNNCRRGGFPCGGYPHQKGFQGMETKPTAVLLESKDPSYIPPGAYGMPPPKSQPLPPVIPSQPSVPGQHRDIPQIPYTGPPRGPPLRIEPPQRPDLGNDARKTSSSLLTASTSPERKLSALSLASTLSAYSSAPSNVYPTPISAIKPALTVNFSDHGTPKDYYQRIPSINEGPGRARHEPETPLPQINLPPLPSGSGSSCPPPSATNAQIAAQLALTHTHLSAGNRQPTQKELMCSGQTFQPLDKELVSDRERCNEACWRFNNAMNPSLGVSSMERSRLFREIVVPRESVSISPLLSSSVSSPGSFGYDVTVEAPFTCDYGYNISIGQNTSIGRNCTIMDACTVKIGNNVVIGPNASLYTVSLDTDPTKRSGSKSLQKASRIIIADDVYIAGNVTILPGVKVGKGATIGAGSVVTKDIPPFTVAFGNPAAVRRAATIPG